MISAFSSITSNLPQDTIHVTPIPRPQPPQELPIATLNGELARQAHTLLHDPRIACVEETRVFCSGCQQWNPLHEIYCVECWYSHASNCGQLFEIKQTSRTITPVPSLNSKRQGDYSKSKHRSEGERAQLIRDDPRAGEVEPRRVLCTLCNSWIKLRNTITYCVAPWLIHADRCEMRVQTLGAPLSGELEIWKREHPEPIRSEGSSGKTSERRRSFSLESEDESPHQSRKQ